MAELTMSINEIIIVLKNTLSNSSDRLKEISLIDKNKIKILFSISKFLPDIPVTLSFHSFSDGQMKFEVDTNYPLKLVQPFINNFNIEGIEKNIFTLQQNLLLINIKDLLNQSAYWLNIKEVKMKNNSLTFNFIPSEICNDSNAQS